MLVAHSIKSVLFPFLRCTVWICAFLCVGSLQIVKGQSVETQVDVLLKAKPHPTKPYLPDFSYDGYHFGEKAIPSPQYTVFDVTTFGAVPIDEKSDIPAIEKAIRAAELVESI
jgi:hypothetical protein